MWIQGARTLENFRVGVVTLPITWVTAGQWGKRRNSSRRWNLHIVVNQRLCCIFPEPAFLHLLNNILKVWSSLCFVKFTSPDQMLSHASMTAAGVWTTEQRVPLIARKRIATSNLYFFILSIATVSVYVLLDYHDNPQVESLALLWKAAKWPYKIWI